jgi:hypothetical protein
MNDRSHIAKLKHTDEHGLPFVPFERGYWRSPFYVMTGALWFAFGMIVGVSLMLVLL